MSLTLACVASEKSPQEKKPKKLLEQVCDVLRSNHYAYKTEKPNPLSSAAHIGNQIFDFLAVFGVGGVPEIILEICHGLARIALLVDVTQVPVGRRKGFVSFDRGIEILGCLLR